MNLKKSNWTPGVVCPHPGAIYVHYHNSFFSAWLTEAELHLEHPLEGRPKVYVNGPGHTTKMAAMAINSNTLSNLLFQNKMAYDF